MANAPRIPIFQRNFRMQPVPVNMLAKGGNENEDSLVRMALV